MEESSRPCGKPSKLSRRLNQSLNMYSLAASAAGVSLLALAPPSQAKIVYTKTHQVIGSNGVYSLDLNHDGIVDFLIQQSYRFRASYKLFVHEALGNAVQGGLINGTLAASALNRGAWIGPSQHFIKGTRGTEVMARVFYGLGARTRYVSGPWAYVHNRYLGLQFQINGKTHYGWARLSVGIQRSTITAALTGYAYETVPNRRLRAGLTQGAADAGAAGTHSPNPAAYSTDPVPPALQPASLGVLALGAQGVPLWRRHAA